MAINDGDGNVDDYCDGYWYAYKCDQWHIPNNDWSELESSFSPYNIPRRPSLFSSLLPNHPSFPSPCPIFSPPHSPSHHHPSIIFLIFRHMFSSSSLDRYKVALYSSSCSFHSISFHPSYSPLTPPSLSPPPPLIFLLIPLLPSPIFFLSPSSSPASSSLSISPYPLLLIPLLLIICLVILLLLLFFSLSSFLSTLIPLSPPSSSYSL